MSYQRPSGAALCILTPSPLGPNAFLFALFGRWVRIPRVPCVVEERTVVAHSYAYLNRIQTQQSTGAVVIPFPYPNSSLQNYDMVILFFFLFLVVSFSRIIILPVPVSYDFIDIIYPLLPMLSFVLSFSVLLASPFLADSRIGGRKISWVHVLAGRWILCWAVLHNSNSNPSVICSPTVRTSERRNGVVIETIQTECIYRTQMHHTKVHLLQLILLPSEQAMLIYNCIMLRDGAALSEGNVCAIFLARSHVLSISVSWRDLPWVANE